MVTTEHSFHNNLQKNMDHDKYFSQFFKRNEVHLNLETLEVMLKQELHINTENLDEQLITLLPYMLAHYIRNWPGWELLKQDLMDFKDHFQKFREYLVTSTNCLIKNGYQCAIKKLQEEIEKSESAMKKQVKTQTDKIVLKDIAPFKICIECPTKIMGSLVFIDSGDDVLISLHKEIPWKKIGIKELVNWPYVSINFTSRQLSFKRKNCGECVRFINLANGQCLVPNSIDFIEEIDVVDPKITRNSYTLNILRAYSKEYEHFLTLTRQAVEIEIIKLILEEFLKDVEEIEMNNTMATNTSVLFNIGKSFFVRSKTASKKSNCSLTNSEVDVVYNEFFIPKMETTLYNFDGVQDDDTSDISFSYLNSLKAKINENTGLTDEHILPTIWFNCELCQQKFEKSDTLMGHLESQHSMEISFKCRFCYEPQPVVQLAAQRWRHDCPIKDFKK